MFLLPGRGARRPPAGPHPAGAAAGRPPARRRGRPGPPRGGTDLGGGQRQIRILSGAAGILDLAEQVGQTPLPPYIRRDPAASDGPDAGTGSGIRPCTRVFRARWPLRPPVSTSNPRCSAGSASAASGSWTWSSTSATGLRPGTVEDPRDHELAPRGSSFPMRPAGGPRPVGPRAAGWWRSGRPPSGCSRPPAFWRATASPARPRC